MTRISFWFAVNYSMYWIRKSEVINKPTTRGPVRKRIGNFSGDRRTTTATTTDHEEREIVSRSRRRSRNPKLCQNSQVIGKPAAHCGGQKRIGNWRKIESSIQQPTPKLGSLSLDVGRWMLGVEMN